MKKMVLFFVLLIGTYSIYSQNYYISFTATGASTVVDYVDIQNITQNTFLTINGNDILHLTDVVAIDDYELDQKFLKIFNNPNTENCYFELSIPNNSPLLVNLFDLSGKLITSYEQQIEKGIHQFNLVGIPRGFYILEVKTKQFTQAKKLISFNRSDNNPQIVPTTSIGFVDKNGDGKGTNATIDMQYNEGDVVKVTGRTGNNSFVYMLDPTVSTSVIFEYVTCMDGDNNHYPIVKIGDQIWMGKNLATTHFINGTSIDEVTDSSFWYTYPTAAYCWYYNNPQMGAIYGALYNWYVANNSYICPLGWHVPTDLEWTELYDEIGGYYGGGNLRATEEGFWIQPNSLATNSTGFTALPAGYRHPNFGGLGLILDCWCRNEFDAQEAWMRRLTNNFGFDYNVYVWKGKGSSIRCLLNE